MSKKNKSRYLYIDNLRLLMIVLVVLIHLSVTYSGIGSWYLKGKQELDTAGTVFFGLFQTFTQAYFMGFLFLISGYFVFKSYNKKGCKKFIIDRCVRLGIPALIYMLIINPFILYVILGNMWERPDFITYYTNYICTFKFVSSSGPLWFALALLIFDLLYCMYRQLTKNRLLKENKPFSDRWVIVTGLIMAVTTFLIRLVQPIDTEIINMQLCFFAQYIMLFIIGIRAGRNDWFTSITYERGRKWLLIAFVPGIIIWVLVLTAGGALSDGLDIYKGGFNWQSAAYALWESLICVSMSIGLIGIFRKNHNKQSNLIKVLSDNSYAVYIFHAPIIIFISMKLQNIEMYPILKFLIVSVISVPVCFLITHFIIRRIPGIKKIL